MRARTGVTAGLSLVASLALVALLVGKWDEVSTGLTGAPAAIIVAAIALQVVALVSRTEAWHVCVRASGGTVARRRLYRASSMGFVGGLLNGQLSSAARIAALRRSAPDTSPRVSALIGAELPILVVEAMLAAATSFTLVGPLGLPWWTPIVCVVAVAVVGTALHGFALAKARWLADGLAVVRSLDGRMRLVGFVLIAVFAQIARNWMRRTFSRPRYRPRATLRETLRPNTCSNASRYSLSRAAASSRTRAHCSRPSATSRAARRRATCGC